MRRLFAIIVAAIALVGCSKDNITESYQTDQNDIYYASFEEFGDKSRTYLDEDVKLLWHEDDRISLFRTTLNEQFKFTGATGDNSGGFAAVPSDEWVTGNQVSTNYAVYPYDATTRLSNAEIIQLTMPAVQYYAENSFGRGANTMVAAAENISSKFLPFRNLCGYIIVKLYGEDTTIKSIEFKGNNDEMIAGAASAEAKYGYLPVVSMSESGTTTITLDCGEEGVTISSDSANPTSFWFVVPPITFEGGFTFTITDINGNTFTKSTTKSQTVVRNEIKSMAALAPNFEGTTEDPEEPKPANNEIWYTATAKVEPYNKTVFGANYVSNEWDSETGKGVITFDNDVTIIGHPAFMDCISLTSVTIPDSVTSIGNHAFYNCSSLTSVTIPDSVTSIGNSAFEYCSSLTSVTIGNSVTSIGYQAFNECSSLTSVTIPDSVTSIGNHAFYNCSNLTNVTIGNSVTSIGYQAFYNCSSLTAFYGKFASADNRCLIVEGVLNSFAPSGLTSYIIPDSVTSIGEWAFYNCSSLTSVTIGNSVTSIGSSAFDYCSSLTSVTIPDSVTSIGEWAFSYCSSLAAFYGKFASADYRCLIVEGVLNSFAPSGLTSYTIPDSVTSIGSTAFSGCTSLTSITIPDSVTSIGNHAFYNCSSLTTITIPDSVTSIGSYAFRYCSLTSVTIPDSVTEIGSGAFYDCSSLTSVTIPDSVTSIETGAFYNCSSLTSVYCKPTTPPTGGNSMFDYNASGRKIYVPAASVEAYKAKQYWSDYADYIVGYDFETGEVAPEADPKPANNEIWYTSSDGAVVAPYKSNVFGATITSNTYADGKGVITFDGDVTSIGSSAFYNCSRLTSVTIPDSVKTIGENTFHSCKSLQSIIIPDSVTEIGTDAFGMCFGLTDITIGNNVKTIGNKAFSECTQVTQITIPDSVSIIGEQAFNCCYRLESITIGRGVTIIRSDAFAECNKLSSIHISDLAAWCNVKCISSIPYGQGINLYLNNELITDLVIPDGVKIMYVSFEGYEALQSVIIPDSVTEFYYYHAFAECKNLKRVVIGAGMIDLSGWTFSYCSNLEEVYCKAITPPQGSSFFSNSGSGYKIYVPRNSVDAYKAASYWSDYADYIVGYDF